MRIIGARLFSSLVPPRFKRHHHSEKAASCEQSAHDRHSHGARHDHHRGHDHGHHHDHHPHDHHHHGHKHHHHNHHHHREHCHANEQPHHGHHHHHGPKHDHHHGHHHGPHHHHDHPHHGHHGGGSAGGSGSQCPNTNPTDSTTPTDSTGTVGNENPHTPSNPGGQQGSGTDNNSGGATNSGGANNKPIDHPNQNDVSSKDQHSVNPLSVIVLILSLNRLRQNLVHFYQTAQKLKHFSDASCPEKIQALNSSAKTLVAELEQTLSDQSVSLTQDQRQELQAISQEVSTIATQSEHFLTVANDYRSQLKSQLGLTGLSAANNGLVAGTAATHIATGVLSLTAGFVAGGVGVALSAASALEAQKALGQSESKLASITTLKNSGNGRVAQLGQALEEPQAGNVSDMRLQRNSATQGAVGASVALGGLGALALGAAPAGVALIGVGAGLMYLRPETVREIKNAVNHLAKLAGREQPFKPDMRQLSAEQEQTIRLAISALFPKDGPASQEDHQALMQALGLEYSSSMAGDSTDEVVRLALESQGFEGLRLLPTRPAEREEEGTPLLEGQEVSLEEYEEVGQHSQAQDSGSDMARLTVKMNDQLKLKSDRAAQIQGRRSA